MIRTLIVDDHAVVRSGLRRVLEAESDIEVVGEAGDARDAVFETRAAKPDVILMDVVMPGKTGIEVIPELLVEHAETKVLILSMQDDPRYVREAFAAGAAGYVLKEAVDTEVVAAVREVAGLTGNGQDAINAAHLDDFQQELVPTRGQPVGLEPPTQDEMKGSRRGRGIQLPNRLPAPLPRRAA